MKRYFGSLTLMAILAILVPATSASADTMLVFDSSGSSGGSVFYDGAGGALVGSGIRFDRITGVETASNSGPTAYIENGFLSFMTGDNTVESPGFWGFEGGGTISMNGVVRSTADNSLIFAGAILNGTFEANGPFAATAFGLSPLTISGFGSDMKNPALLDFFGIGIGTTLSFATTLVTGEMQIDPETFAFSANVAQADLVNAVPEPGIFSLAVLGLGVVVRRRSRR